MSHPNRFSGLWASAGISPGRVFQGRDTEPSSSNHVSPGKAGNSLCQDGLGISFSQCCCKLPPTQESHKWMASKGINTPASGEAVACSAIAWA